MPVTKQVAVKDLMLDLGNYRTVRQPTEAAAVQAMVAASPDRFWALADSLLSDGYLPTDTIIVLEGADGVLTVKEGNRRIGVLKLVLGILPRNTVPLPSNVASAIAKLSRAWKSENKAVPCAIFPPSEAAVVDRIVARSHGKGEKAGRDRWNAVAGARHNRDHNKNPEPALDLLEKYLIEGKNVTANQKVLWAGSYPLSVLAEAIKKLAPRLGKTKSGEVAAAYPDLGDRTAVEAIIHDIGRESLGFDGLRNKEVDFAVAYGIAPLAAPSGRKGKKGAKPTKTKPPAPKKPVALAITDPRAVRRHLAAFQPRGALREKVETLRQEAVKLDVSKTPLAFCFILRSMFEISAKAYCADHPSDISVNKADGKEKHLAVLLREVTEHLKKSAGNKNDMQKALHGAITELARHDGLLSVTSMNQLVHNPRFTTASNDVAILFGNVFPLLQAMNS